MRSASVWFAHYSREHQNPTNRLIHWICVPAITWAVIGLAWLLPVPVYFGIAGLWAVLSMILAIAFYFHLSPKIGLAMAAAFIALSAITDMLYHSFGSRGLGILAIVVFVIAWMGQFIGHRIEGCRPSFFTDLQYLLIGPAWLMSKALRRFGVAY